MVHVTANVKLSTSSFVANPFFGVNVAGRFLKLIKMVFFDVIYQLDIFHGIIRNLQFPCVIKAQKQLFNDKNLAQFQEVNIFSDSGYFAFVLQEKRG